MLKLRPFKPIDAETIVTWCKDEVAFRKWTSDRYESFPITAEDMNQKYIDCNGDCSEADNFYPFTAFDESGIRKTDLLVPNVTICLYHGEDKWDGPRTLREMMDFGKDAGGVSGLFEDYSR